MKCPGCAAPMETMTLVGRTGGSLAIDLCHACQAFWFDGYEILQLSPAATLKLFHLIGEQAGAAKAPAAAVLRCPRCAAHLQLAHDFQRGVPFQYWRCEAHGRFIGFVDFLREKNFIRPLSPQQLAELRQNVQMVNCSNCGAPIDISTSSVCSHCGAAISMVDVKQVAQVAEELKQAAAPKAVDPDLPLKLAMARREVDAAFPPDSLHPSASSSLVDEGLRAVARWLKASGHV